MLNSNNLVMLVGTVSRAFAYYGDARAQERTCRPRLSLVVFVPRNQLQQTQVLEGYHQDGIRVVLYGDPAKRAYELLDEQAQPAVVIGWLKSRKKDNLTLLEVVADRVVIAGQMMSLSLPEDLGTRLQLQAALRGMPPEDLVRTLLEPQLDAIETPAPFLTEGITWNSKSPNER
jgi:hypothetical protein